MIIPLSTIRRAQKIKVKDIRLNPKTIRKIESGPNDVSLAALQTYLDAIGMQLTISLK